MAQKGKFQYLAYVGTTKVAFLQSCVRTDGRKEVTALSARLAQGFERGIVKDLAQANRTLSETAQDVAGSEGRSVTSCRLVVSNAYLKSYTFQSSVYFNGNPHPVTLRDIRLAIAQTRSVATIPLQEVIIQAVPQEFLVNDLVGVQNPLGLEASRLGVTLRLLTLDFLVYNNLLRVFERCDCEVEEVIPSFLSAANGVLTPPEKQEGVILVVVGGTASHLACYRNSVLVETRSIPVGGDLITEVIEKNMNIEHLDAQRVKEAFGSATPKMEFQDELIPIPDSNGRKKSPISRFEFERQMNAGLQLFFTEIEREIKALQKRYSPINQVVFTGGGTRLEGFLEVMKENVSPNCRIGTAERVAGPKALIRDPAFSGILGGIDYTSKISEEGLPMSDRQNWMVRTVERARNWIFEYL